MRPVICLRLIGLAGLAGAGSAQQPPPQHQATFQSGVDRASAFLQIYQDAGRAPLPARVTARITDTSDRILLDQVTRFPPTGSRASAGRTTASSFPIERLEPGEYLLTIDATQDKHTARRGLRFTCAG